MPPARLALLPAALAGALLVAPSTPARAQPAAEPVRFAWVRARGAEACATGERVAVEVAVRLRKNPFSPAAARSIDVLVTRTAEGHRASLVVRDAAGAVEGDRELVSEGPDCAALASAAALALALAIDPAAALAPPPAAPDPPLPPPPPRSALAPALAPAPARAPSSVSLRGAVGLGLLPRPSPGLALAGSAGVSPRVALTGEALFLPEVRATDARFAFGLTAFALGACATLASGAALDLGACGAVWAGSLHAVVHELVPAAPGDYAWAAVELGPRLRVRLASAVHAELGAHLYAPLVRRPFLLEGHADPVFRQSPVAAAPWLGLGANF
jgi:hypothetical protein